MKIDREFLNKLLGDDLVLMGFGPEEGVEVVEALCETLTEYLPPLRRAVVGAGLSDVAFFAHALKGTFNNFSGPQLAHLAELFKEMEREAKSSGRIETLNFLMRQVEDGLNAWVTG
ncbi:MAG: Hpt domain-containing protein [Deltaproteobacteria bacterium]|nr:Hpt domain-containing protein [Deltaproteobacteria bacterium]